MSVPNSLTYPLQFDSFSLEFELLLEQSIHTSCFYSSKTMKNSFAVVVTWLKIGAQRHLIADARHPGNFLAEAKEFIHELAFPKDAVGCEQIFPVGGWAAWMRKYWMQVAQERVEDALEAAYENMAGFSVLASRVGHVAAYTYNGVAIVEAATRSIESSPVEVCSKYDPNLVARELRRIATSMDNAIRNELDKVREK